MAAGDPGVLKRNFSATAIQTTLVNNLSSAATGDVTTNVAVASVSGFPSVPFTLIIEPDGSKEEVVTCTALAGTTLTLVRGQDGTQAYSHAANASVRHGVSGRDFKEEQTHIAARGYDADSGILANASQTHVHGLVSGDGSVVGADQSVTLTRKTLTTPVINGATLTGTVTSTASIVVSGAGTITGLSSAGMVASSATPKNYVDAILGSATAASTSATSAATSATSAATSATSAAASASASASSASAAATSASSALTSQTAAATSATSAAASATAAATSATSAGTSATASASSASAAATSASSAATSASSAATSATASASSASAAATSASSAATSATSAAASTSAAAASASAAATSATSASASATAAATSATSAATSASSALTSQTAAATSATSAATSASSALTSQTAAATSAASAATSASDAATTYDNFDDRYLGSKSTAPTVDNDGNTLLVGAIYWNSTVNNMYVWSGSTWVQIATTSVYTAPTLGSTAINSGATVSNVNALTINSTTIPTSATLAKTADKLSVFAATTSAELAGVISDETGSGALVFATSPTLTTPNIGTATGTSFNSITGLSSTTPSANGTAAVGTATTTARADHVHPTTGLGLTASGLNQFAATTSAQLAGVISDETGSGSLVFGTSPTITPAEGTTSTAATGAGYMGIPQNATTTGAATIAATDAGKHIYSTATRTITIPANSSVALPVGTAITFVAGSGATVTIAITTDTMYLAGPGTTGSRTLAAFGMATALKIASTTWIISGNGLT